MPAHRSHGRRYIEPERHDELSDGARADEQAEAGQERTAKGRLAKGASTVPRQGGKARKGRTKMSHDVGSLPVDLALIRRARFYRRKQCSELAATVGGGVCGLMASALVKLASEDMALRESALEKGNVDLARRLGESTRMHLLYAREVAAKDGDARARAHPKSEAETWRALGAKPADADESDDE